MYGVLGVWSAAQDLKGQAVEGRAVALEQEPQARGVASLGRPNELRGALGLTRFRGPIRVKRSGSVKGVEDGQERQAVSA